MSFPTTKRELALEAIRLDYAKHGKDSGVATRLYVENRISYAAFRKAASEGQNIYSRRKNCQHLDYRDTLDGAICNDCGLEVTE